jgi:hypothetical protein
VASAISVREDIMVAIASVLENLYLGSDAAGNEDIIQNVEREYFPAETYPDPPVAFVLDNDQRNRTGADGAKLGTYDNTVNVRILIVAMAGRKHRDEPLSTTGNRIIAYVSRKLMAEAKPADGRIKVVPGVIWLHVDGNSRSPFGQGAGLVVQRIDVSVRFRHSDVDPAVPAG